MALLVVRQIVLMLIILIIGCITYKTKLISLDGGRQLSNLLLYVVNPLMVFMAFLQDYDSELLKNFILTFIIGALAMGVLIPISFLLVPKKHLNACIERYAIVYNNVGFFGIPVVNAVLGSKGVLYLSAFIAAFNIYNWSHGVTTFRSGEEKISAKTVLKNMLNPTIIAAFLGFIFFFLRLRLPELPESALQLVADTNTPLAMIIAGIALSQNKIADVLRNKRLPIIIFISMFVTPALVIIPIRFLPIDVDVKAVLTIALACPAATTINSFALTFNKDSGYAAQIYSVSTIFAALTIPLFMLLYR
ncbi:MAG: AEC family transporter [Lachnospiraceae bacterium]|jgi:predicted permease|nr:AEC family transporter [Lachnospiraceae bacterium]